MLITYALRSALEHRSGKDLDFSIQIDSIAATKYLHPIQSIASFKCNGIDLSRFANVNCGRQILFPRIFPCRIESFVFVR